ncbi:hypothetical protein ACWGQ5_42310 [Streptomyces sp. NPDC055722]
MWEYALARARFRYGMVRLAAILSMTGVGIAHYVLGPPAWVGWITLAAWTAIGIDLQRRAQSKAVSTAEYRSARQWIDQTESSGYIRRNADGSAATPPDRHANAAWPPRLPLVELYLLLSFLAAALYGVRGVLTSLDSDGRLGSADTPAIVSGLVGVPAIIAAAIVVAPQLIRAWGEKAKFKHEGEACPA